LVLKFGVMLDLKSLQRKLGYKFKNNELLVLSLTHRSFATHNNERLEFLGDAILSFVITEYLFEYFPAAREGQLSRLRSKLVKEYTLAQLARKFELGSYLQLGTGEVKSGGDKRDSILADAMESVIGAIYKDSEIETVKRLILRWFIAELGNLTLFDTNKDPKTQLQEFLQARSYDPPQYEVLDVKGKPHCRVFTVKCITAFNDVISFGSGKSRRIAEQEAALSAELNYGTKMWNGGNCWSSECRQIYVT